ncbi:MAG: hypothetical protein WD928_14360 [Gammaproteobacteria bacterium]
MKSLWLTPLALALLAWAWFWVQRAWVACMQQPADTDALARVGGCGAACACKAADPDRACDQQTMEDDTA